MAAKKSKKIKKQAADAKKAKKFYDDLDALLVGVKCDWEECVESEADGLMAFNMPSLPKLIKFIKKNRKRKS